ncbi:peptidoglycan DD-metalloendopeptidase family protein [Vibrio methylphosphonaticus]|uniref:peptidoglycan DD-metalloendopeptidase family protein n=1 Tax=Vibrio methylphosphonaticus TaxID=2946866 RepID=UPI00202A6B92|nr:peptidoglycan DD-metalloendopeptidase family protein [Vibrio methylphosphonaticus]MCL9773589.1 peptidoglycan DD-metalloendopeptidase family protein [Vibrio methylphosphonaticus]
MSYKFSPWMLCLFFVTTLVVGVSLFGNSHRSFITEVFLPTANPEPHDTVKITPYDGKLSGEATSTASPERDLTNIERVHYFIQPGDSLSTIFETLRVPLATIPELLSADISDLKLDNLVPNKRLEFVVDRSTGTLITLTYHLSLVERSVYSLVHSEELPNQTLYHYDFIEEKGEWTPRMVIGDIVGSFAASAHKQGLSSRQISTVSRVMADKINFARDLRPGDRFEVLVSEQYLGSYATGNSEIQGVRFYLGREVVSAFLARDGRFYDRDGNSLEQAFNRYPIAKEYRRITSPFNRYRKHPVTGRVSPHNGTDFATPVGAPIYSTGDGKVVAVREHPYAGKYLTIEHNSIYTTRYLHLSRFLVKPGELVKRGQKIALSGATGRLTGPHLHFEVLVRNRPVDPMQVDLPLAQSLADQEKDSFATLIAAFDDVSSQQWQRRDEDLAARHAS